MSGYRDYISDIKSDQDTRLRSNLGINWADESTALSGLLSTVGSRDFQGSLSPSIYENARLLISPIHYWVQKEQVTKVTEFVEEKIKSQNPDGSWGEPTSQRHLPDQIINTLVLLIYLVKSEREDKAGRIRKAKRFLARSILPSLMIDKNKKTFAYSAMLVALLQLSREKGIHDLTFWILTKTLLPVKRRRLEKKLGKLEEAKSSIHSILDVCTDIESINWESIAKLQEPNGSMGIYPSSTIATMENTKKGNDNWNRSFAYINRVLEKNSLLVPFFPSENFEKWWVFLALVKSPLKEVVRYHTKELLTSSQDISVTEQFSLKDLDTSAVAATVIADIGGKTDLSFMEKYYIDGRFICYQNEYRVSPSANIHALMAFASHYKGRTIVRSIHKEMVENLVKYVLQILTDATEAQDKWHSSYLYTLSHAVEVAIYSREIQPAKSFEQVKNAVIHALNIIANQQKVNGSWGDSTEETSYAVRALTADQSYNNYIREGVRYLQNNPPDDKRLWIGKTLYNSYTISMAQHLSAISLGKALLQKGGLTYVPH